MRVGVCDVKIVGFKEIDKHFQMIGIEQVVVIQICDVLTSRGPDARVARCREAAIGIMPQIANFAVSAWLE